MCDIAQCIYDITPSTFITSYTLYMIPPILLSWQHNDYTWHLTHYIWPHVHCICVITPTLSIISQPICVWHHNQYSFDILSTIFMTSYRLCMTSQHCVLMTPHSAYVWHPLHYRWHHIHSITPNHRICDVTSTSGMTSHPSHPLYLCHHNLSTDITPTLVWHHTHYMCDILCTLYNITSTPMSSHYCTYDITTSIYETTSSMLWKIYTIHVTSQPLICVITPTVLTTSHAIFVPQHTRHM